LVIREREGGGERERDRGDDISAFVPVALCAPAAAAWGTCQSSSRYTNAITVWQWACQENVESGPSPKPSRLLRHQDVDRSSEVGRVHECRCRFLVIVHISRLPNTLHTCTPCQWVSDWIRLQQRGQTGDDADVFYLFFQKQKLDSKTCTKKQEPVLVVPSDDLGMYQRERECRLLERSRRGLLQN
jgi:hypothetical protein